jgi:anti-sigma factor RsiW
MRGTVRPVTENDLHAYADGLLTPGRRVEVDAHLEATPDDAARIAAWRRLNENLHSAFDGELDRAVPQEWTAPPRPTPWQSFRAWQGTRSAAAAAAVVLLFVGAAGGWIARGPESAPQTAGPGPSQIAYYAARAYDAYAQEVRHAVEVPGDQEEHLVRWLSNRMGAPVKAPNLGTVGYKLMGGRLLPSGRTLAAQFMYEDPSGARLTLYVKSGMKGDETAFQYREDGGVAVFFWVDGPFGYALAGRLSRESLLRAAQTVYTQINH